MNSVTVIVPAWNAEHDIGACIQGILNGGFQLHEVIVVDDGSTDKTRQVALGCGVRVIENGGPHGPANSRNLGVSRAADGVIVFIDADVVIKDGARARILEHLRGDHSVNAVFGSYDDQPYALTPVSRYRNLLHHYVHQTSKADAETFWTGYGAVHKEVFDDVGGLDPKWEDIEDVEFGTRLCAAGYRIRLDPTLTAQHRKVWTLRSMIRTDVIGRAIPWTMLLQAGKLQTGDLNLSINHRVSAFALLIALAALLSAFIYPPLYLVFLIALSAFVVSHLEFFLLLKRLGGLMFMLQSVGFHILHNLAAICGYVLVKAGLGEFFANPRKARRA